MYQLIVIADPAIAININASVSIPYDSAIRVWCPDKENHLANLSLTPPSGYELSSVENGFEILYSFTVIGIPSLTFSHSASFGNDMQLNFYVPVSKLDGYDNVSLKIEKQEYTNNGGDTYTYKTVDIDTYTYRTMSGVQNYRFIFNGIAAKEMGNEIKAYILADKNGHTYTSDADVYSIKAYAYACLESTSSSITPEFKTLVVDMLNYGASSQRYFKYNLNNLVNADLTEEQKAMGTH
jgi:hypothetical protein